MIEMLLYMGIFSILLVVLLQLFGAILATHTESQATSSIDQDGNFILARLAYDIHNSSSITYPALGTSCTWPTDSTCHLTFDSNSYTINSGNLMINGSDQLNGIGTMITSMTFIKLGNTASGSKPSVQIRFTLESQAIRQGNVKQRLNFQTTIGTR